MKNADRQKKLDEKKWLSSEKYEKDLSGNMWYCLKCEKMNCRHNCTSTQKEREEKSLCAIAYNKYYKVKKV